MADVASEESLDSLLATARAWRAAEPDDDIATELDELIAAAESGNANELRARFAGRLQFGTAGLRAAVAAGSMRMNRLVVRQAAAGLGQWLLDQDAGGAIARVRERGVVIGHDARRKSDAFADDSARVLAAMGIRSMLHPGLTPTPVLAWSITGLEAAAGIVVTASHNPPADNGYKVYLPTGSQIVSPTDA
ncbi:MAG: phospho-sugar mutase, partial [Actinomycetota bacterium]